MCQLSYRHFAKRQVFEASKAFFPEALKFRNPTCILSDRRNSSSSTNTAENVLSLLNNLKTCLSPRPTNKGHQNNSPSSQFKSISEAEIFPFINASKGLTNHELKNILPSFSPLHSRDELLSSEFSSLKKSQALFKLKALGLGVKGPPFMKNYPSKIDLSFLEEIQIGQERSIRCPSGEISDGADDLKCNFESKSQSGHAIHQKKSALPIPECAPEDRSKNRLIDVLSATFETNSIDSAMKYPPRSINHFRTILDRIFQLEPHPPPSIIVVCVRNARVLGSACLAYSIISQLHSNGLVGTLRALDSTVYHELILVALTLEKSIPRAIRFVYEMSRIGVTPSKETICVLDFVLQGKRSHMISDLNLTRATSEDARLLWEVLVEVNFSRFFGLNEINNPLINRLQSTKVSQSLFSSEASRIIASGRLSDLIKSTITMAKNRSDKINVD